MKNNNFISETVYLSVVIPAYNEARRISKTLLDIDRYLSKQKYAYEIIVVSDGAKDETDKVVSGLKKLIKNLELIDNETNHGKGYVVRQGLLAARGQIRLFMDADNSTTISHFEKMKPLFDGGEQIAIGTRDRRDNKGALQTVSQPFFKRLVGDMGNLLIQLMAVPGIWDTQCGFKAFTAEAAKNIFGRCQIDRWGFDIEALALARKFGYRINLIPVAWVNDPDSKVNLKGYLNTLRELFKIKWNLISGKYGARS